MGKLLAYLIISGITMLAMYLVYKLFIARDNQHDFNRGLLLAIYLVSFSAYPVYNFLSSLAIEPVIPTEMNIAPIDKLNIQPVTTPSWGTILIWIFMIGASFVTVRTVITWIRIVRVVRSGERIKKESYTLVIIDNDKIAPFSWMRYVVISGKDFDNQKSAIIAHELKHIRSYHWLDLLISQVVCIVNWFNPGAWLMRDELMLVHEYQADMAVISGGHNPHDYQMLLIKKAVGSRFPSLANSINHSKLKKRITMMYKAKSCAGSKLKALALVPMVALALGVVTVPAVKAAVSTISNSEVSLDKGNENLKSNQVSLPSGMKIVLDGKSISEDEMRALKPESIGSIIIDKASNLIVIHSSQPIAEGNLIHYEGVFISNTDIYLDGKKISASEMKALDPATVASMSVDKENNRINITSK